MPAGTDETGRLDAAFGGGGVGVKGVEKGWTRAGLESVAGWTSSLPVVVAWGFAVVERDCWGVGRVVVMGREEVGCGRWLVGWRG